MGTEGANADDLELESIHGSDDFDASEPGVRKESKAERMEALK